VLCVYYEAPDALVLIDPLVPRDREDEFWRELDSNLPVRVLLTAPWHRRDADTVADRLGGTVTRHPLPSGVEEFAAGPQEENQVAFFIRPSTSASTIARKRGCAATSTRTPWRARRASSTGP
jgi:hypothetical protein